MKKEIPMKFAGAVLLNLLLLASAGCDTDEIYAEDISVGTVETLKNGVAVHKTADDTIHYFDGDIKSPKMFQLFAPKAGEKIVWMKVGPESENATQLFVLTAPKDERDSSITEQLYRVTTDKKAPTVYSVESQFDAIVFSPDKHFAILYHGSDNVASGLYNPNEVALVDLTVKPGNSNPKILSVSMDGRKIDMVTFVESIHVGGTERQLAVFTAGSIVRIVDLNDPENTWAKVPLLPSGDTSGFVAAQLIALDETEGCDNASCEAKLFIRSPNTQDIYYITLGRSPEGFEGVQTKQLEAGGYPSAMELIRDGETPLMAILSWASGLTKITIVDFDTSAAFDITINDTATHMKLLTSEESGDKLALWGDYASSVYFLTATDLIVEKGRNLTSFVIQGGISYAKELSGNRLLIVQNNQDVVLLDLAEEKAAMLSSSGGYDWQRAEMYKDFFYVVPSTSDRVDYYNLTSGSPDSLLLDDLCLSMHILTGRNTGLVWHNTKTGRVTLFPLSSPTRAKAKVVDGLWLTGSLNAKGEN
jgi:hypothetical protein